MVASIRWSGSNGGETATQVACLLDGGSVAGLSDAQLLDRFATRRSCQPHAAESAFAALVARHGPMVHRTCRALLRDGRDAEEAFQATFVVLARRAGHVGKSGGPLGPWLHGVARRVALKARGRAAKRSGREGGLGTDPPARPERGPCPDLLATLHAEIGRLPEKYRRPVVLCHLEGLTHAEAAAELGWPVGTVSVRLARARDRLRGRLARRGFAPADAAVFGPALWAGVEALPPVAHLVELAAPAWIVVPAAAAPIAPLSRTTMMTFSGWKWLLVPLALIAGAAGGVAAVHWSEPKVTRQQLREKAGDERAADEYAKSNVEGPQAPKIPADFFRLPVSDPKEGPVPARVKFGQNIVVEVLEALPGRPITGERTVRPDGTISLGFYGDLRVADLDRYQVKVRLIEHLRKFLSDEVLGLIRMDAETGKIELIPPVQSDRVFVDEAVKPTEEHRPVAPDAALLHRLETLEREVQALRAARPEPSPAPADAPK